MSSKAKKFFPLILSFAVFATLLVAQMSLHGTSSSASRIGIGNEKAQAYESLFGKLQVETTQGTKHKLSEVKQPVVILNFWASWCRPCLSEFKSLTKLVKKFGTDKILVIGLNNDTADPLKAVKKVEKDLKLNFESAIDEGSKIAESFFINEIPASIVYHKGKLIHFKNKEFDFMGKSFLSLIEKKLSQD